MWRRLEAIKWPLERTESRLEKAELVRRTAQCDDEMVRASCCQMNAALSALIEMSIRQWGNFPDVVMSGDKHQLQQQWEERSL